MKKILSSVLFAVVLLAACEKISDRKSEGGASPEIPEVSKMAVFDAGTETAETKSSLSQNGEAYDVLWSEEDKIRINGTELTIQTADQPEGYGPGYTKARFAGNEPSRESTSPYYRAYFPSSMLDWAVTNGWFLPAQQTYVSGSIKDAPMYAASDAGTLSFKNLCGVIRLNLKGSKSITTINLIDRADAPKALSGRFTVSDNTAVVQGSNGVSLQCADPVTLKTDEATPFMISVPVGSYEKLQITIFAEDGTYCKLTGKNAIVVERSLITDINISNPNFKSDNAVITYTTTGTKQISAYLNAGDDASKFGDGLTVVSHTYDAAAQTGVITLSGKATRFGYQAFFNKTSLKTISFPETITSVDEQAFYSCSNLEDFDFSHIISIGARAFQGAKLYGLVIPENVESIAERAFNGIGSTTVDLKGAPATMGPNIFDSSSLISATIDRKIAVPTGMFSNCRSLTGVTFKDGALSLGDNVFENCRALIGPVVLPAGTKSLGANLFRCCYSLIGVIIPNSVETIGAGAFQECTSIERIIVPNSVKTIGNNAFYKCTALKKLFLGTGITSIGTTILRYSDAVESLMIKALQVPALAGALNGGTLINIYVPDSLIDAYKAAANWSAYSGTIQAITEEYKNTSIFVMDESILEGEAFELKVALADADNRPLTGLPVRIVIKNVGTVFGYTGKDGIAIIPLDLMGAGTYSGRGFFDGDDEYLNSYWDFSIRVLPSSGQ